MTDLMRIGHNLEDVCVATRNIGFELRGLGVTTLTSRTLRRTERIGIAS